MLLLLMDGPLQVVDFAEISVGGKLCRGKNVDSPICDTTLEHLDIRDRHI